MLFNEPIANWSDWKRIYQSISVFEDLIKAIFTREKLPDWRPVSNLAPGTNAVFRAGRYVVKLYAPSESGMDSAVDFSTEQNAVRHAAQNGVPTPTLRASGELHDRFLFRYLVMDYVEGPAAGVWLQTATAEQKRDFALEMREICRRLHRPAAVQTTPTALQNAVENVRWQDFPERVQSEICAFQLAHYEDVNGRTVRRDEGGEAVCVHGDLTSGNILIVEGKPFIIDFADSTSAPEEYDLPSVLINLFDLDPALISWWKGKDSPAELAERCFAGILLHDFGRDYLSCICRRLLNCEPKQLPSLEAASQAIVRHFLRA